MFVEAVISSVILCISYIIYDRCWRFPDNPPGPFRWPIIGNLDLFLWERHEVKIAEIQRHWETQVMTLLLGSSKFVICNSARALRTARAGVLGGRFPDGLFEASQSNDMIVNEGTTFAAQRKLIHSFLVEHNIATDRTTVISDEAKCLTECFQKHADRGEFFDPTPYIECASLNVICRLILGTKFDYDSPIPHQFHSLWTIHSRYFLRWARFSDLLPFQWIKRFAFRSVLRSAPALAGLLWPLFQERIQKFDPTSKPTCYVDVLLAKREEFVREGEKIPSYLEHKGIFCGSVIDLVIAGSSTGLDLLKMSMPRLADTSIADWQQKMYRETEQLTGAPTTADYRAGRLKATDSFMKEILRTRPEGFFVPRRAMEDTKICGYTVQKNTGVLLNLWAIHNDPEVWTDPGRFDPSRFYVTEKNTAPEGLINEHGDRFLPFGCEPRKCIGYKIGEDELCVMLSTMVCSFRFKECRGFEDMRKPLEIRVLPR